MSRRAKRIPRSPFVVTAAAVAVVGACGGAVELPDNQPTSNPPPPRIEGNPDAEAPTCPRTPPTPNTACTISSKKSCDYGTGCGGTFATCVNGRWQVAVSNPPPVACPAKQPVSGESCSHQCGAPDVCRYADRECNGVSQQAIAECRDGRWIVSIATCNPPPPWWDGGPPVFVDAGAHDE